MQDLQTAGYVINAKADTKCFGSCQALAFAIPVVLMVVGTPIFCCYVCFLSVQKWWRNRIRRPVPTRIPMRNRRKLPETPAATTGKQGKPETPLVVSNVDDNGSLPAYEPEGLPEYDAARRSMAGKMDEAQEN